MTCRACGARMTAHTRAHTSRAAMLRALHERPVTYATIYTGPTREEELAGVKWTREHGHRTERRGVLQVRSRDLVFWDERFERKPGNGLHFFDLRAWRVEGGALVEECGEFRHELTA